MNRRVVVIGGGVSGLAAAWLLSRDQGIHLDVMVLEKQGRAGGKMSTLRTNGLVIEEGPNGFLDSKPQTLQLVRMLGMEAQLLPAADTAKKRFLFSRGRLRPIPGGPAGFLFSGLMPLGERLRVFAEPFIKPGTKQDETVAEFVDRRLGRGARERLVTPMVSGIYAGDPEALSMPAVFPTLFELERRYGSLVKGMFKRPKSKDSGGPSGPSGRLTSFRNGTATFIQGLADALGPKLHTHAQVVGIRQRDAAWEVTYTTEQGVSRTLADALVLATPAYESSHLLTQVDKALASMLGRIPYAPITVVSTAYHRQDIPHPLGGFGYLVPRIEGVRVLGTLWDSEIFDDRAPDGLVLLRTMLGGAIYPDIPFLPQDEQVSIALNALHRIMGIAVPPVETHVFVHEQGIPQFTLGYLGLKSNIQQRLTRVPGLFLCNNSVWGVGLNDCVAGAFNTDKAVRDFLMDRGSDHA